MSVMNIDRALIIKKQYLDLILDNQKTWEMRSTRTNIRGKIGLIESGTGLIVGEANLIGCGVAMDLDYLSIRMCLHQIEDLDLLKKWKYPWALAYAKRYDEPISYDHPQGAVVWVKI